jgi:hypothetical protein
MTDVPVFTAGLLAEYLAALPRELPVILSSDSEGNSHSPLAGAEECMYAADSTFSGDAYPTPEDIAEDLGKKNGWTEEDAAPDDAIRAVVLTPTR